MNVLTVNAGSSSLKLRVLDADDQIVASETLPAGDHAFDTRLIDRFASRVGELRGVGHRVVHGGERFSQSVVIDDPMLDELRTLVTLAPLHQRACIAGIEAVERVLPGVPAIACFDTAFHATLPPVAATYAIPMDWSERYGIRRYGFHGLSHSYAVRRAAEMVGRAERVVTCHLGAGASLAAIRAGVSVDTTMGFTPLEGLVMSTRSGTIDPGLVLWLHVHGGRTASEVSEALEQRSGLQALADTSDMRTVIDAAAAGEARAQLALGVYVYRLCAGVASMVAALQGIDVLVFTGGVGERAPSVRAAAADRLAWMGVHIDEGLNRRTRVDADISDARAQVKTLVVESREDLEIAQEVRRFITQGDTADVPATSAAPTSSGGRSKSSHSR